MDAKVLVVFLIVLVLALSTAKKGRHLRRIGGNTLISSYILYKFWGFSKRILRNNDFSLLWTEFEPKHQVNKHRMAHCLPQYVFLFF